MEIIISSKPIYEQITSQIKAMIMSGTLQTGDPIPLMRALAKSIHVSVITVQSEKIVISCRPDTSEWLHAIRALFYGFASGHGGAVDKLTAKTPPI